ncbi:MAG: hypothetical protein C4519_03595 [Desulfobacteraceae bacterium]|nr:MAG: hypothetical protein C4519_03595 [Desulfobacteraceae bacterium]
MYNAHFGFREKPFKLVPNPDYLYLSKNHEIALAHLTYAVSQGDGFVVITGEVGTGKTTLCRLFLERLEDDVESAYIFNPQLDSIQLLASICNEFGIRGNHGSLKQLLDVLNDYLILKNQDGRKVLLLIDEAQNLSIENLEMVRMLSNLETTRNKLLQIILVGQPELGDKLDSYELRQLAQRISLSAHLTPLGPTETVGYIQHRLSIAAQRQLNLFTRGACRRIHRFSGGIPRLINIACDRALLTAFSLNRSRVTAAIAGIAVQELASRGRGQTLSIFKKMVFWSAVSIAIMLAAGILYSKKELIGFSTPTQNHAAENAGHAPAAPPAELENEPPRTYKIDPLPASETPAAMPSVTRTSTADVRDEEVPMAFTRGEMAAAIQALEHRDSRLDAVARVLESWRQSPPSAGQLPAATADTDYFEIAAHQYGLRMYTVQSNWSLIKQMNLPAILPLKKSAEGEIVYMALVGWREGLVQLVGPPGQGVVQTTLDALLPYLHGPVYLYWKNALGFDGLISSGSPAKQVGAVKNLLRRAGYGQIDALPVFDQDTAQAILDFQSRNSLEPDGLIGPLTKIFLIQAADIIHYPRLDEKDRRSGG